VKFYHDEPRTLMLSALVRPDGTGLVADCALRASRILPGDDAPRWTTHFTGRVRLAASPPAATRDETPTARGAVFAGHDDIYRVFFHGPAYQVIDEAWHSDGDAIARLADRLPPAHIPPARTVTEPRLAEACLQAAGLWEVGHAGRMALPAHADLISVLRSPEPGGQLFAVAHPGPGGFDCRIVDASGNVLVRVDGYRTAQLPDALPEKLRAPIHDAMTG
jgi:hypothetical protein